MDWLSAGHWHRHRRHRRCGGEHGRGRPVRSRGALCMNTEVLQAVANVPAEGYVRAAAYERIDICLRFESRPDDPIPHAVAGHEEGQHEVESIGLTHVGQDAGPYRE